MPKGKFDFKKIKGKGKSRNVKGYLKTVERLIRILSMLDKNKHRTYSTEQLAKEFDVNQRTIQRDIRILQDAHYPILEKEGERGRYHFPSDYSLRKAPLTKEQESLLSFMYEIATNLGGKFHDAFQDLFRRLLAEDLYTPFFAKVITGKMALPDSSVVRALESALDESSRIKIKYHKLDEGQKEYTLEPVKIAYYDGFWYLIAQNKTRDDVIKFRLDRINKVDILDEIFVPSVEVDKILSESVNVWFGNKRGERVLIEIEAPVARYFEDRVYFPLQKVVKKKKDGTIVIETFPAHPDEIFHTIMHWIPYLKVIEPVSLKEEIKTSVKGYLSSL